MPKIRKFNEKEQTHITRQYKDGIVIKAIAKEYNASVSTIRNHLRKWLGDEYDEIMKARISYNANIRITNMMQRRIFNMNQNKD
jgi:transposase